jgi:hypothetical protein
MLAQNERSARKGSQLLRVRGNALKSPLLLAAVDRDRRREGNSPEVADA